MTEQVSPLKTPTLKQEDPLQLALNQINFDAYLQLKWLMGLIIGLAYGYVASYHQQTFAYIPFIILGFILLVEYLAQRRHQFITVIVPNSHNQIEPLIFLVALIGQGFSLSLWHSHPQLLPYQLLALHLCAIFYVASRYQQLAQQRLGIMSWYDCVKYLFQIPCKYFFLNSRIWHKKRTDTKEFNLTNEIDTTKNHRQLFIIIITFIITLTFTVFAWQQLIQVSHQFRQISQNLLQHLLNLLIHLFNIQKGSSFFWTLLLAIPISKWLFGLLFGALLEQPAPDVYQQFQARIRQVQIFPRMTTFLIIGCLCLIYSMFILSSLTELDMLLGQQTISAPDASTLAVAGFWQLVRVTLLNFLVLALLYLISKEPIWDLKYGRWAYTLLFVFTLAFALIAAWKLFGVYVYLFGWTALRLISGWFIVNVSIWSILVLIRFYYPIQAIRMGILFAVLSFTGLCLSIPVLL